MNAIDFATFDINALSLAKRTEFYRDAVRRAHAARADAVRGLFRASKNRFRRQQVLIRALACSAAVLVAAISIDTMLLSAPVSARLGIVSIGYMSTPGPVHAASRIASDVKPRITPNKQVN